MSRPTDYHETHVLAVDVPYRDANKSSGETHASEGILHQGRVVWSQRNTEQGERIRVYAEGVGLIELPADALSRDRLASRR